MSKIIKSLLSIMTAFLLLMTMAVTNVNAAVIGGGSSGTGIFIRNPRVGHTYKAYKVLDLNSKQTSVNSGKSFTTEAEAQAWTNANGGYYYQSSEWDSTTQTYITVYKCSKNVTYNLYSISTSNPFYSVVSSYSGLTLSDTDDPAVKSVVVENSFSAKEFVKLIRPIMETETPVIEATATTTAPLKLTVREPGYYALNTTVGTVIDTVNDLNPDGQVYIDDKNSYYELKTTVSDHDVEIGDVVKFTVLVDTPKEITDFGDDYVFEVNTTIPEGLKFNGDVKIGGLYDEEPIRWQLYEQNSETGNWEITKNGTGTAYQRYAFSQVADETASPAYQELTEGIHYQPAYQSFLVFDNYYEDGSSIRKEVSQTRIVKGNNEGETIAFSKTDNSFSLKFNKVLGAPVAAQTNSYPNEDAFFTGSIDTGNYANYLMSQGSATMKITFTCVVTSDEGVRTVDEFGDQNLGMITTSSLTYSCDSESTETKTNTSSDRVRTGNIVLTNVLDEDENVYVPNGEYVLQNADEKYYKFCKSGEYHPFDYSSDAATASYTLNGPHIEWVDKIEDADVFKVDENGRAVIKGLEPLSELNIGSTISTFAAGGGEEVIPGPGLQIETDPTSSSLPGMYKLIMIKKPAGYNQPKEPTEVVMTVDENTTSLDYPITIMFNQGYLLPTTGEIGGLIMALIGCVAVFALVIYLTGTGKR